MKWFPVILFAAACTSSDVPEIPEVRSDLSRQMSPVVSDAAFASFVDDNTAFATDLYKRVRTEPGNLFMSPHSISIALAMTYAGANGSTATQMATALHFALAPADLHAAFNKLDLALASRAAKATAGTIPFRLQTANGIFGQDGLNILQPFLDTLALNYGAGLRVLDFESDPEAARLTINEWVEAKTNDKIKQLLPERSITDLTRLVLTNAIYFSAAWDEPFVSGETQDRPFWLGGDAQIAVPMMHKVVERQYGEGSGFKAAELEYDGDELSMVVVVPDDLATFESTLDVQRIKDVVASLSLRSLDLTLPKFKFDAPLKLGEVLKAMGMTDAFNEGTADLSGIDGTMDLVISDVLHKGFVAIDENGTEAAAATAVVVNADSAAPEPAVLNVDRPFMFFIRDRPTGAILFVGRVTDPH
jgi:serpin B